MPKVIKTYDFEGGMNTESDPRDLKGQVSDASNAMFDVPGRIRAMGQLASTPVTYGSTVFLKSPSYKVSAAYGLYTLGVDYPFSTPTVYNPAKVAILAHCRSTATGQIIGYTDSIATKGTIGSIGTTPSAKMVYYYVDGALRVCDSNFGASNKTGWYGKIDRIDFDGCGSDDFERVLAEWYWDTWTASTGLAAPTAGVAIQNDDEVNGYIVGQAGSTQTLITVYDPMLMPSVVTKTYYAVTTASSGASREITGLATAGGTFTTDSLGTTWDAKSWMLFPPIGNGFVISMRVKEPADPATTAYEFAESYLYEGGQESPLHKMDGYIQPDAGNLFFNLNITKNYNDRVTGGRVYFRVYGTAGSWLLLADASFEKGVRTSTRENTYAPWMTAVRTGSAGAPTNVYGWCIVPLPYADFSTQLETYESLTGISQDVTTLSIQAKWFETGNTRAWAGGIKSTNAAGSVVYHGDRIMYTPPGKYDTWPPENYIDVGKQNGKPCKAGRIYADRLLDFREDILYIINVAQGADTAWYLESEHPGLGVKTPGATFACDIGILWANRNGCYWYDGERVNNLLEEVQDGKLVRTLSRSAWKTFVTDNAVVGYDPQRRQVVVLNDASQTQNTTTYIFDMATRTWAYGTRFSRNIGTGSFTNFAIYDNELVIGDYRG